MDIPDNLNYTKEHEWVREEAGCVVVGVTDYAQEELGDIVYLELPDVGEEIVKNEVFGTVESVKTTSDLFAPASGKIVEVNDPIFDAPELVNNDPYGDGWMIRVEMSDPGEISDLMSPDDYKAFVNEIKE